MQSYMALQTLMDILISQATSPQTGVQQSGGSLKSTKEKRNQRDKDSQDGPILKTAGAEGELTAGLC